MINIKNPNKVKQALEKTGFPLEVMTFNTLRSLNIFPIRPKTVYKDEESGKQREVDIYAFESRSLFEKAEKDKNFLWTHYVIQCKKTDKAWVFFTNDWSQLLSVNDIKYSGKEISELFKQKNKVLLKNLKDFQGPNSIHRSFTEIPSPSTRKTGEIYEEIITTLKPLMFYKKIYSPDLNRIFLPIIVFDGILWSASLRESENIDLRMVNSIFLRWSYWTSEEERFPENIVIFIISKQYLHDFFQAVRNINKIIFEQLNPQKTN